MPERRPAAFLDRDGTLIEDRHYLASPDGVVLLPGAAAAVRRLNARGVAAIVITNQSGIAQGLLSEAQYASTRRRLDELLEAEHARLDAHFHCPHHPDVSGPCSCRKPGTKLYEDAAAQLHLDLTSSLFVGDRWRDVAPALALGGRGVLVPSAATPAADVERARAEAECAATLAEALDRFLDVA
jgi:D-glycero-D-manno-heptose 1,7-bisphosphate phosphatase